MSDKTRIEWCDATWNPILGCSPLSEGCDRCFAARMATRLAGNPRTPWYRGLAEGGEWTGKVMDHFPPMVTGKNKRVFAGSMTDVFHESVPSEWLDALFGHFLYDNAIANGHNHTFMILTKRPARMRDYLQQDPGELLCRWAAGYDRYGRSKLDSGEYFEEVIAASVARGEVGGLLPWPLPNCWMGVTAENQKRADERIPILLNTPAVRRFVSIEPMLGPVDLTGWKDLEDRHGSGSLPDTWDEFVWPEWVPASLRKTIIDFWTPSFGRSPRQWWQCAVNNRANIAMGARVGIPKNETTPWILPLEHPRAETTGRFVYRHNNMGSVVLDDGREVCVAVSGRNYLSKYLCREGGYRHRLHWVICGGETGPGARLMHPDWVTSLRDQCVKDGVPFFFKQWGEWAPNCLCGRKKPCRRAARPLPGSPGCMFRCGKKAAGRELGGRICAEVPRHGDGKGAGGS